MSHSTEPETPTTAPTLPGGATVDVIAIKLAHAPVAPEQDGGDHPTTGAVGLGVLAGATFGVWEMSIGTMFDVEAEEIFVVIEGRGQVVIDPFGGLPEQALDLFPGTLMRLSEGMKTTWTITETLRKVYVTPDDSTAVTSSDRQQQ